MTSILRLPILAGLCIVLSGCVYFSTDRQINYGLNHYEMGLPGHAIPPLIEAARSLEKENPPDPRLVDVLIALGNMAQQDKRNDLAADFFSRALKAAGALQPADAGRLRNALVNTGLFKQRLGQSAEALPLLQRAADISRTDDQPILHAIDLDNLAQAHSSLGQFQTAIGLQQEARDIALRTTDGKYLARTRGTILHNLGDAYAKLGREQDAEACFRQAIATLSTGGREVEAWRIERARKAYAELLRKAGRNREAQALEAGTGALRTP